MRYIVVTALVSLGCAFAITPVLASSAGSSSSGGPYPTHAVCDVAFRQTLEQKAQMEIQREIQVNNTVIGKPPSVLALSCFKGALDAAGNTAGNTFSSTGNGSSSLRNAINNAMGTTFSGYFSANFNEPNGYSYATNAGCANIRAMWNFVKCSLAQDDGLLSQLDYHRALASRGDDVRSNTGGETCRSTASDVNQIYDRGMKRTTDLKLAEQMVGNANYFSEAKPQYCSFDPKSGDQALGNEKICEIDGQGEQKCAQMNAVPTGLIVQYGQKIGSVDANTPVWSYACLNPGCYFDVAANIDSIKLDGNPRPPTGKKCAPKPYEAPAQ
jgi:hypothetical protein